jgi:hypothetical protein
MRRTAAVGSFFALVTGCGYPEPVEAPRRRPAATTAPSPQRQTPFAERFEWIGGSRGERGGLAFAVPETDAVGVSLECHRGSRSVRVSTADPLSAGIRLAIGAGETRTDVPATPTHDSMIDDSIYAVANLPADDGALQAFRASGEMWVWDESQLMRAETDAEREAIEAFFRFCGSP